MGFCKGTTLTFNSTFQQFWTWWSLTVRALQTVGGARFDRSHIDICKAGRSPSDYTNRWNDCWSVFVFWPTGWKLQNSTGTGPKGIAIVRACYQHSHSAFTRIPWYTQCKYDLIYHWLSKFQNNRLQYIYSEQLHKLYLIMARLEVKLCGRHSSSVCTARC